MNLYDVEPLSYSSPPWYGRDASRFTVLDSLFSSSSKLDGPKGPDYSLLQSDRASVLGDRFPLPHNVDHDAFVFGLVLFLIPPFLTDLRHTLAFFPIRNQHPRHFPGYPRFFSFRPFIGSSRLACSLFAFNIRAARAFLACLLSQRLPTLI